MNCSGYERQMSDYIDGLLSRANEDAIRFHLNGCPRCRLKKEDMESSIRAVKSLPPVSPQPEFAFQLSSLLTKEMTRELYAASWWRRVSEAYAELGELSRQRPVQLVFATSLILTISVIGGFAGLVALPERSDSVPISDMTVALPTPFEPELAPPDPVSPFPLESELAPHMAIKPEPNAEPASNPPSFAATSLSFSTSRLTSENPGIMTVRTMEPTAHGIRSVSTGTGMRLDPSLFAESFVTVETNDPRRAYGQLGPLGPLGRLGSLSPLGRPGPPAPIRRIRISF